MTDHLARCRRAAERLCFCVGLTDARTKEVVGVYADIIAEELSDQSQAIETLSKLLREATFYIGIDVTSKLLIERINAALAGLEDNT